MRIIRNVLFLFFVRKKADPDADQVHFDVHIGAGIYTQNVDLSTQNELPSLTYHKIKAFSIYNVMPAIGLASLKELYSNPVGRHTFFFKKQSARRKFTLL